MTNRIQEIILKIQGLVKEGCLLQLSEEKFIIFNNMNSTVKSGPIYFSPFFTQPDSIEYFFSDFSYIDKYELLLSLRKMHEFEPDSDDSNSKFKTEKSESLLNWQIDSKISFSESFSTIQTLINEGQIEKAVPIVVEASNWVPKSVSEKIKLLVNMISNSSASLKIYAFFNGSRGIIGATPELLFERKGKLITTMALAGTYPKFEGADPDYLLKSVKDLSEHLYVVKNITEKLQKFGTVSQDAPHIVELPTMWHLKTNIQVELTCEISDSQLMNLLHPTAALGLYSKTISWQQLENIPHQNNRFWFGAPLGVTLDADHFLCLVCIRNIEWCESNSRISSGCGIVKESKFDLEWNELKVKRDSVKKLLGI